MSEFSVRNGLMLRLINLFFGALLRMLYSRRDLFLENLALRQQLAVLRSRHPRPRFSVGKPTGTRSPQGGPQNLIDDSEKWRPVSRSLSPDGQWSVELSSHGLVLEEASTGREVAKLEHDGEVLDAAFSPKGRWLATSSREGIVRLWPLQAEDMIERACKLLPRNLTPEEWKELKLEGPYRKTCPNLPVSAKQ
jgi:WD40 repeat protein